MIHGEFGGAAVAIGTPIAIKALHNEPLVVGEITASASEMSLMPLPSIPAGIPCGSIHLPLCAGGNTIRGVSLVTMSIGSLVGGIAGREGVLEIPSSINPGSL